MSPRKPDKHSPVNGPSTLCSGCRTPVPLFRPICDKCLAAAGVDPKEAFR